MDICTREQLSDYAMELCLPLMERTAERREKQTRSLVNDSAGYLLSFAEAFCRPLWGIAPVLCTGKKYSVHINGKQVELCSWIRRCVLDASDETSPFNWNMADGMDEISYANQMKTELAGLMVGIYFARNVLWDPLTAGEKKRTADWIFEINRKAYEVVWDCNHIWFVMLCLTVLKKLGFSYPQTEEILNGGLERLDRMYVGNGFYQDGKFGRFDYYNPWAMHTYPLLWCMIADNSFQNYAARKRKYIRRADELLNYYSHLFDRNGCHVPFGRSLSYRFAAVSIFPLSTACGCRFDPGLSREIMLRNINYFKNNAQTENGILPPGFLYNAPQAVENYTSDGGAYWCTKAFLSLLLPDDHPFWSAPCGQIPSDLGPYLVQTGNRKIHMPVTFSTESGVTLYNNTANYLQENRKTQWFLDMAGFYSKFAYNTRTGFGISTRDSVSSDNMISLITPDGTQESHRFGFEDRGTNEDGNILYSCHKPFSNDPETRIETAVLIIQPGLDVRVHKVTVSQPYTVLEGGFCVPLWDDRRKVDTVAQQITVGTDVFKSRLIACGTAERTVAVRQVQPGMNLMAPMAVYPSAEAFLTVKGSYIFATVCAFGGKLPKSMPEIIMSRGCVKIRYQKKSWIINSAKEKSV
jgi:hypothetical protein